MGSSKKQTVGYRYSLGMHQILVHGPVDHLSRYTVDERTAWQGFSSGGRINVYAESLFGGEGREGGISGAMDFENGGPDQMPNDYLQSKLGGSIPAFRGVAGVVQRQMYLGNNPYLKKNAWRLQRINVRQDGIDQWYKERAGIGSLWTGPQAIYIALDISGSMDTITSNGQSRLTNAKASISLLLDFIKGLKSQSGQQLDIRGVAWGGTASGVQYVNATPANVDSLKTWFNGLGTTSSTDFRAGVASASAFFSAVLPGAARTVLFITDGEPDVGGSPPASTIATEAAATLFAIPGVKSFAYNIDLTNVSYTAMMDNTPQDGVPVITGGNPDAMFASLAASLGGTLDMNPAHIIRECLTDPIWGMGYAEGDIDDDSFTEAADRLFGEIMGISLLWDRQMPIEQFIGEIIKHINAAVYVHRKTGKFVLRLIRGDYDLGDLPVFDESNCEKVENFKRVEVGELTNSVSVNFWDSTTGKTSSQTAQDPALVQQQGAVINTTMQYPGFTNQSIVGRIALRDLRTLSTPLASCTLYANADSGARDMNIGDVLALSWEDYGLVSLPMRITAMTLGDGKSNKVKLTLTQDTFFMPDYGVITPPDTGWEDPSQEPLPISRQSAEELPYYEMVQQMTQSVVDAQLATEPDTGILGAAASRPQDGAINARFTVDAGAGYEDVGVVDFCPSALLDGAIGRGPDDDIITAKLGSSLDSVELGTYAKINSEYVYLVSRAGLVFTVKRGVLDTVPQEHPDESVILFSDPFIEIDPTEYVASDSVSTKLLTVAGQGTLADDLATPMVAVMNSRAIRPYPPGNLKINGEYDPGEVLFAFDVSWESRNRTLQTSPDLVGYYDGSVTPEAGTTYTVRFFVDNDMKVEYTGVTDTFYNGLTFSANGDGRVEVVAVRDGYESWQVSSSVEFPYTGGLLLEGTLPVAYLGVPYSGSLTATGGVPPIVWSLGAGAPAEWSIDPDTGEITGTATVADTYEFDVIAEDDTGEIATSPQSVVVSVGDQYWANVHSLMHFNGADGSDVFTDQTGRVWTKTGTPIISTTQSKFGGASFRSLTNGSYLSTPHVAGAFDTAGDITVEAWVYRTAASTGDRDVIASKYSTFASDGFTFQIGNGSNPGKANFSMGASGTFYVAQGTSTIPLNTWVHICGEKEGKVLRIYVNGVLEHSATIDPSHNPADNSTEMRFAHDAIDGARTFTGYIDEFRWTQGVARYKGTNFTPATAEFPSSG